MNDDAYRLIRACFESLDEARELLRREPTLISARTGLGETPLHFLSVEDQLDAVKLLFDQGAAVNTLNRFGNSALAEAASLGYVETVAWMLANGAMLALPGQSDSTLHEAVNGGSADVVRMVLEAGADVAAVDSLGYSPLHAAAGDDERAGIIPILVAAGADIDCVALFDDTPLDLARRMEAHACADVLVRLGARSNRRAS
jgi:ankyrin repeat protein